MYTVMNIGGDHWDFPSLKEAIEYIRWNRAQDRVMRSMGFPCGERIVTSTMHVVEGGFPGRDPGPREREFTVPAELPGKRFVDPFC